MYYEITSFFDFVKAVGVASTRGGRCTSGPRASLSGMDSWNVTARRSGSEVIEVTITNTGDDALGPFVVISAPPTERRVVERVEPGEGNAVHLRELDATTDQVVVTLVDEHDETVDQRTEAVQA
jgi:hypothetical protein